LNLGPPHLTPQHTMFLNGPGPADVSRLAQSRDDRLIIHPRGLFNPSDRRTTAEREAVNSNSHAYFGQIPASICPIDASRDVNDDVGAIRPKGEADRRSKKSEVDRSRVDPALFVLYVTFNLVGLGAGRIIFSDRDYDTHWARPDLDAFLHYPERLLTHLLNLDHYQPRPRPRPTMSSHIARTRSILRSIPTSCTSASIHRSALLRSPISQLPSSHSPTTSYPTRLRAKHFSSSASTFNLQQPRSATSTSSRIQPSTLDPADVGVPKAEKVWGSADEAIRDLKSGSLVLSAGESSAS
jgi:hypothetical protein